MRTSWRFKWLYAGEWFAENQPWSVPKNTRLATEFASREELLGCLNHLTAGAGNASLMTPQLCHTLCDHAAGNYRILTTLAAELLAAAAQRDLPQLDEKLYLDVFAQLNQPSQRRAAAGR